MCGAINSGCESGLLKGNRQGVCLLDKDLVIQSFKKEKIVVNKNISIKPVSLGSVQLSFQTFAKQSQWLLKGFVCIHVSLHEDGDTQMKVRRVLCIVLSCSTYIFMSKNCYLSSLNSYSGEHHTDPYNTALFTCSKCKKLDLSHSALHVIRQNANMMLYLFDWSCDILCGTLQQRRSNIHSFALYTYYHIHSFTHVYCARVFTWIGQLGRQSSVASHCSEPLTRNKITMYTLTVLHFFTCILHNTDVS